MIKEAIGRLSARKNLTYAEAYDAMDEIMSGKASAAQTSAYLTAMAMKNETPEELTASASAMRAHCVKLLQGMDVLEIVGTGGSTNTFNVSTTAALVVAAGGVKVAKHGNRMASGKCGAADVLEALGVNIMLPAAKSVKLLDTAGICFLFAQNYHIAMKYVVPARRELGIRTLFDVLGPLADPAGANMGVMGVTDEKLLVPLARVLSDIGVKSAMVECAEDGADEISASAPTRICEAKGGKVRSFAIAPEQFGMKRCKSYETDGGTPMRNAATVRDILAGRERGPKRDAVLLNAGAMFAAAGRAKTIAEGVRLAAKIVDDGAAADKLEEFVARSRGK